MTTQFDWRTNDTLEITVPMSLRLEEFPSNGGRAHPEAVALLYGPLVLFTLRDPVETGPLAASRDALLAARRSGPMEWTVDFPKGVRRLVPFSEVGERFYTTYLQV